ncbi:Hsp20/alpha crystallin family protein [Bacillus sp. EB600]|uniref:Hsp20/alpha crystallin family protein n=1 Tax=Bacillus sp. EB600 TaxID=2806345 RepID=UPI00210D3EDE|nr:Hsp20/alpha crystallin family protein [Bacillus sp. EB600]MCQ6280846.1 Hsp20/alpha crystallin family protein [Bacillus sp. EB600]
MTTLSPFRRRKRDLRSGMWDLFSDFFNDSFFAPVLSDTHHFRTDIKDDGDQYVIEAELPGLEKDDIIVEYSNNYLMISAKREADMKVEDENYIRQERYFGNFIRRFYVEDIDDNAIDATFKNGILTLKCPKLMLTNTDKKRIEIH